MTGRRIALHVSSDALRRALFDVLAAAGHDVRTEDGLQVAADLHVVSEPSVAGSDVAGALLCLRPGAGREADRAPVESLRRALASGGRAVWAPPLRPSDLLDALGAAPPRPAEDAPPAAAGLHLAPDPWWVLDVGTLRPRWANAVARGAPGEASTPFDGMLPGGRTDEVRAELLARTAGLRRVEVGAGARLLLWWTERGGQRVAGLLPSGRDGTSGGAPGEGTSGNARTLVELGRTLAVLAHELRNPLASLAGAFDVLQATSSPEDQAEVIALARDRLSGMRSLLDDVLRYARPLRGEPAPVEVADVVASALATVRADPRHAACRFEAPGAEAGPTALAHEEPLRQALVNLLLNAAESQGGRGEVRTEVVVEERWVVIRVIDEGPGVAPEHAERVFEPFWTTKPSGTGLGLAHVRRVAEAAGGRVRVEPSPATGACFRLDLPLVGLA